METPAIAPLFSRAHANGAAVPSRSWAGMVLRCFAPANAAFERASRISIAVLAFTWIGIVGMADYTTGPQTTMIIFYLIPVTLGTWYLGAKFGVLLAIASIATSSVADLAYGLPHVRYWNEFVGLVSYLIFVTLLSRWRALLDQLDERVRLRTAALEHEVIERTRLQKEISEITERERRRLGHELHDRLCQHLAGTALAAQILTGELKSRDSSDAEQAEKVVALLEQGIDLTRNLARGLVSPDLDGAALAEALESLAQNIRERFRIDCEFQHDLPDAFALDSACSTQLYRIAQEAVTNAARHAKASRIIVELDHDASVLTLNVFDDGIGFTASRGSGLGIDLMRQGADAIGASFSIDRNPKGGTRVSCCLTTND